MRTAINGRGSPRHLNIPKKQPKTATLIIMRISAQATIMIWSKFLEQAALISSSCFWMRMQSLKLPWVIYWLSIKPTSKTCTFTIMLWIRWPQSLTTSRLCVGPKTYLLNVPALLRLNSTNSHQDWPGCKTCSRSRTNLWSSLIQS